ncbi:MAG: NUDIX domain-containing protein [Mesorhizobium sp.]
MSDDGSQLRQSRWSRLRSRLFHTWFLLRRPMTLGARGLVYDRAANAVFLIEHTYVPGWQLPGGGVETGETMLDALTRELREEGNIELTAPPLLRSIHQNRHASPRDHVGVYLVEHYRQTAPKTPDHEIRNAGFFPVDALPENTTAGTRRRIAEIIGGDAPSQWW